jgi:glycerol-3-phosphate dehydrogenase (NAD(P)+)
LVATCTSNLSRNYQLGYHLGSGLNLESAKEKVGQVAEGIRTLEVIKNESSNLGIKMPLVDSLYNIIYESAKTKTLIDDLVNNPNEVDVEFKHRGN